MQLILSHKLVVACRWKSGPGIELDRVMSGCSPDSRQVSSVVLVR